jgi:hypothetical protein
MTKTMLRTPAQNAVFYKLLMEANFDDDQKGNLVMTVSTNRTKRSSELTIDEMQAAINKLKLTVANTANKRRTRILAVARQIGYVKDFDYTRLNEFILKYFKVKTLFDVPNNQLSDVITAIERVRSWKESKALEEQMS